MKIHILFRNDSQGDFHCENYKFESGFLALSNPKEKEDEKPSCDGVYISCSEIKLLEVRR